MLAYFKDAINTAHPGGVGISGITLGAAVALDADTYPKFSKYFYSTLLTAHSTGKCMIIHMKESTSEYLQADRIWLLENLKVPNSLYEL